MSDSEASKNDSDKIEITEIIDSCPEDNIVAVEAISERLAEVTALAEELDQALQSAQQDCAISTSAVPDPIMSSEESMVKNPSVEDEVC